MFEYLSQQAQLGTATLGFEDDDTLEYLMAYSMLIVSQLILNGLVKLWIRDRLQTQRTQGLNYDVVNLQYLEQQLSILWRSDRQYWQKHFVFYAMANVMYTFKCFPVFLKVLNTDSSLF